MFFICVSAHSPPVSVKPFPAPVDDGNLFVYEDRHNLLSIKACSHFLYLPE